MKRSEIKDYRQLMGVEDLFSKGLIGTHPEINEFVLPDGNMICYQCDNLAHECICDYALNEDGAPERVEDDVCRDCYAPDGKHETWCNMAEEVK